MRGAKAELVALLGEENCTEAKPLGKLPWAGHTAGT